ncbi:MAG: hypothetical protein ACR2M3_20020 [Thermomicrobiales bacterium]
MAARRKDRTEKGADVRSTTPSQAVPDVGEEVQREPDQVAERRAALKELTRLSEDAGLYDADYRSLLANSR